jgi:hypothetical protein
MLTNHDIINAATEAGLCLPRCWSLDRVYNKEDIDCNQQWIANAPSDDEEQRRREIVNRELELANSQLQKLRSFVAILLRVTTHKVVPVDTNRRQTEIRFRFLAIADELASTSLDIEANP